MTEIYTGECVRGAIRREFAAKAIVMKNCRCRDRQRKRGTKHGSYLTFADRAAGSGAPALKHR